jgi:SAM-dependent methyltransferase
MFLRTRDRQSESLDSPGLSVQELADAYRQLGRVNRLFQFADPFQRLLVRWLGRERCRSLSILDLGAGDGSLAAAIVGWSKRQGWDWRVTSLDVSFPALCLANGAAVCGSVCRLPFRELSFDVVIASQMAHHLADDAQVVQHLREAWRVTRDALLLNDLHRNAALYALLWLLLRAGGFSRTVREDGLLSVRRGWRVGEWRELAEQAGIPARVWLYCGARVILQARK